MLEAEARLNGEVSGERVCVFVWFVLTVSSSVGGVIPHHGGVTGWLLAGGRAPADRHLVV